MSFHFRTSVASETILRLHQTIKDINNSASDPPSSVDDTKHESSQADKGNELHRYADTGKGDEKDEKLAHPIPVSDDYLMPVMHDDGYLQTKSSLTETDAANYVDIPEILNHLSDTGHSRHKDPEYIGMNEKECYEGLMTSNREVTDTERKIYQQLTKTQ